MSLSERLARAQSDRGSAGSNGAPADGKRTSTRQVTDPFSAIKQSVHQALLADLGPRLYDSKLTQGELEQMVRATLQQVMNHQETRLSPADRTRLIQEIADDILGYGPIEPFLRDASLTEVMVNGPYDIWIERDGKLQHVEGQFASEDHLRRTIEKIVARVGRRCRR